MPALPNVPKVIRLSLRQALSEDVDVVNRIFMAYTGTQPTSAELTTFATDVAAAFVTRLFANLSHELTGVDVVATDLTSPTAPEVTVPMTGTGASVTASVPAGVAFVISHLIARRYRGGHPRIYIAGVPNDQMSDAQKWSTVIQGALGTDWQNFLADVVGFGWTGAGTLSQVNVSYYEGFTNHTYPSGRVRPIPNLRATPVVDPVTAFRVNVLAASQRRRNLQP